MSDIGKGSVVQAVRSLESAPGWTPKVRIYEGSLYRVAQVEDQTRGCRLCGSLDGPGLMLEGQEEATFGTVNGFPTTGSWCACNFRPFPGPSDDAKLIADAKREAARDRRVTVVTTIDTEGRPHHWPMEPVTPAGWVRPDYADLLRRLRERIIGQ